MHFQTRLLVGSLLFFCLRSPCSEHSSLNLSLWAASLGAGVLGEGHACPAVFTSRSSPRAQGAAGVTCWQWIPSAASSSLSCSGFIALRLKLRSGSLSLSGKGLRGFCVMQGSLGRKNACWHNFISFTLLYHCFFWFSWRCCRDRKQQTGSRDVWRGRTVPLSRAVR